MNLNKILKNISLIKILNLQSQKINCIKIDTRKIQKNDIFIGIKGCLIDGNKLYKDAFNKGASIAIVETIEETKELNEYLKKNNKTIIVVKDSIKCLGELATYKRSIYKGKVIAITGSTGKTSTKDIIFNTLSEKYQVYKTPENLNNHIGLPLSILEADLNNDFWILEMGMNHLGEISYLSNIAKPDIAVITNIGTSHIGNLGSKKNILKAKLEILDGLKEKGLLIINNDNDYLYKWYLKNKYKYNIKTIGIENNSDYQAENIKTNEKNITFTINNEKLEISFKGEVFIYNALMGYAIAKLNNLTISEIKKGIEKINISPNRMNIIDNKGFKIINDCYNSNYESCKNAIKYLSKQNGRKIAVLGTILELGKYSKKYHSMLGNIIFNEKIDILITVGEYTNLINQHAIKLGFNPKNSFHFQNNLETSIKINEIKRPNDIFLIKASNSMNFKEIVDYINV